MRLTREADYAVLALIYLGAHPEGTVAGGPEIAEQLGISNSFLSKVLGKLTRAGIVRSYPGARGGYELALPVTEIQLSAILEAIDGPVTLVRCIDREGVAGSAGERARAGDRVKRGQGRSHRPFCACLALEGLARVQTQVTQLLERVTLADVMPPVTNPLHSVIPGLVSGSRPQAHLAASQATTASVAAAAASSLKVLN
jgi:Rrf2 family protein